MAREMFENYTALKCRNYEKFNHLFIYLLFIYLFIYSLSYLCIYLFIYLLIYLLFLRGDTNSMKNANFLDLGKNTCTGSEASIKCAYRCRKEIYLFCILFLHIKIIFCFVCFCYCQKRHC